FYSLRKVAVIQQQIAEINLEKQKIAERRKILNKEIVQQQAQRKHWWLKGEKYDRLTFLFLHLTFVMMLHMQPGSALFF
ncbi:hypothetical protein PUR50_31255, partial [Enterobacter hormaechei subsp. steigerwaltii]|nr:hypothetical protein [Enterobacter hormaechei subsp. steigerwaltii]